MPSERRDPSARFKVDSRRWTRGSSAVTAVPPPPLTLCVYAPTFVAVFLCVCVRVSLTARAFSRARVLVYGALGNFPRHLFFPRNFHPLYYIDGRG